MITNVYNLPEPLYQALCHDGYEQDGDISVTGLIQPPRIRQLTLRHRDEIVEDASDKIWSLIGTIGHRILEGHQVQEGIQEERLSMDVWGWKVTGKPDLWHDGIISDYKFTTVWSYIYGLKREWEEQLNLYAELYRNSGFNVEKLQIVFIFRDWMKSKVGEDGYPECQVKVVDVPFWTEYEQDNFIMHSVMRHKDSLNATDNELPYCTPEERWERPAMWAVKKEGNKRAARVFNSQEKASEYIETCKGKYQIEYRPGKSVRCESFCAVNKWCNQYQEMINGTEC